MTFGTYNYNVKLSFNRDKADWIENIVGIENMNKYIMKLIDEDIEKWKKIETEVLQPIVDTEKKLEEKYDPLGSFLD